MMMNIEQNIDKNFLVITPKLQVIDHKVAKDFKAASHQIVEDAGYPYTILNLEEVQFIDSSGFSAILSILKFLSSENKDLVIVALNPPIQEIFDLMGLDRMFQVYPTVTEAQHALNTISCGG